MLESQEELFPMSPQEGPPFPRFLRIKWPGILAPKPRVHEPAIYKVKMESFTKARPEWDEQRKEMVKRSYHSIRDSYVSAETEDQALKRTFVPPDFKITQVERVREENDYYVTSTSRILKELVKLE